MRVFPGLKNIVSAIKTIKFSFIALWALTFLASPAHALNPPSAKPKNVILIIGDGMGPQQIGLAMLYARHSHQAKLNLQKVFESGEVGLMQPIPSGALVIDSACAATQLATGQDALSESIGLDLNAKPIETIAEKAKRLGKGVGLVSDTRLTHATPAAFGAHVPRRSMENEIAVQLLEHNFDVLLSGGLRHFIPREADRAFSEVRKSISTRVKGAFSIESKRNDSRDLLVEAEQSGYKLAFDRAALLSAESSVKSSKLLGLFASSGMPDAISEHQSQSNPDRRSPSLADMTQVALRLLESNPKGFFLMVEAGQIDWAGHANDAGWLLHEMLRLDNALGTILDWAKDRDDTLIVITADHETGGFGFSYSGHAIPTPKPWPNSVQPNLMFAPQSNFIDPGVINKIMKQKSTFKRLVAQFESWPRIKQTADAFMRHINAAIEFPIDLPQARAILLTTRNRYYVPGHSELGVMRAPLINDFSAFYTAPSSNRSALIARALAPQQGVVWATGGHTSTPVPVLALGPKNITERFDGWHSSAEIGKTLLELL